MKWHRAAGFLALAIVLSSCSQPEPEPTETPVPVQVGVVASTVSPTAFQPVTSTPRPTATSLIPWDGWATPIYPDSSTPIPYPLGQWFDEFRALDVYAVMGSDHLPHRDTVNTDAFALVFVGPEDVSVISLPRDLYLFLPGWGMTRVNAAWGIGGEQAVRDMVAYNFGVNLDHFVLVDMTGFVTFVDWLGGVRVVVHESVYDRCGDFFVNYLPGEYDMDGQEALCYARARKNTSDFDRIRRQADVMDGIFRAVLDRLVANPADTATNIYKQFEYLVSTDMDVVEIAAQAVHAVLGLRPEDVRYYRLTPPLVTRWIKPETGAYLLIPPPAECLDFLLERAADFEPWENLPASCPTP